MFPWADKTPHGSCPCRDRGLDHMAPTYFVGTWRDQKTLQRPPRHQFFDWPMTTRTDKQALRRLAKERRAGVVRDADSACRLAVHADAIMALATKPDPVVSAYLAIGSELDPALLVERLAQLGATIALPVMVEKAAPLEFRAWRPGSALVERMWGIREPGPDCARVEPDILLVPLLFVDAAGNRLGYGGGFYDRTLQQLRLQREIKAVGVAFPEQSLDEVPHEHYDERLDYLLTPAGLVSF